MGKLEVVAQIKRYADATRFWLLAISRITEKFFAWQLFAEAIVKGAAPKATIGTLQKRLIFYGPQNK